MTTATTPLAPARSDRRAFEALDWWLFAIVGTIWGSSFLLIKIALGSIHPGTITWARVALGATALMALPSSRIRIAAGDRNKMALLSIVWVGIPFTLYPLAEQHIDSAATGLLTGATPLFAVLIGAIWFGRPTGGPQRLALVIGFAGVALISIGSGWAGGSAPVGVVMILVSTVCYGFATNLAGDLRQRYGSVALMGRMLVLGVLWTTPFGLLGITQSRIALGPMLAIIGLGVVGTGLAFGLMARFVGRVGGPRSSFVTYLMPTVALVLGATLLQESVATVSVLGAALVLVASILASRAEG